MNAKHIIPITLLTALGFGAANAQMQEKKESQVAAQQTQETVAEQPSSSFGLTGSIDYLGRYIFRGLKYAEKDVIQTNITATYNSDIGSFSLNNFTSHDRNIGKWNEIDLLATYARSFGSFDASATYTHLWLPNQVAPITGSKELSVALTYNNKFVPVTLRVAKDFDEGKGSYLELSAKTEDKIGSVTIAPQFTLGHNWHYWRADNGFSQIESKIGVSFPAGDFTVSPSLTWNLALKEDPAFDSGTYLGLSIGYTFK